MSAELPHYYPIDCSTILCSIQYLTYCYPHNTKWGQLATWLLSLTDKIWWIITGTSLFTDEIYIKFISWTYWSEFIINRLLNSSIPYLRPCPANIIGTISFDVQLSYAFLTLVICHCVMMSTRPSKMFYLVFMLFGIAMPLLLWYLNNFYFWQILLGMVVGIISGFSKIMLYRLFIVEYIVWASIIGKHQKYWFSNVVDTYVTNRYTVIK